MSFLFRLDGIDLSPYVRVAPADSMDPYGSGWQQPAFSEAPFAEGHPLLNVDAGNREMLFPLYVKGVASGGGGSSYAATVLADSPLLHWRFGESVGTTAADASGNARTGAYTGSGVTYGVAGALSGDANTAVTFDGVNGEVSSTYNPFTGSLSFDGWDLRTASANRYDFFSATGANAPNLRCDAATTDITFYPDLNTPGSVVTWAGACPIGSYFHWALTWNNATKTAELFINGVSQGTHVSTNAFGAAPGNIRIGTIPSVGKAIGTHDEFAIYSGVLSSARILVHYQVGTGTTPSTTAKDNLHAIVAQINNAIANPASSPLRVEWKDSGASNSTFYDVTFARLEPAFNYRLSEHSYADLHLHVWCAPPYGHTATERIIATAAGTAPGLTASLIGVASPLTGDVAPQTRVTLTTSGEPVGPAGRGVIVSAPSASGYVPFISAASFVNVHPSAGVFGASGAPGSQALYRQPAYDSAPLAQVALGATMYAGRKRVYAAVLPAMFHVGLAVSARNQNNQTLGPTAVARRPEGWQLVDMGTIDVATTTPTSVVTLLTGANTQSYNDAQFQRPLPTGAPSGALGALAGVYVLPEAAQMGSVDRNAAPVARGFFGASGGATSGTFTDELGVNYVSFGGSLIAGASGAYALDTSGAIANAHPLGNMRARAIAHQWNPATSTAQDFGLRKDALNFFDVLAIGGSPTFTVLGRSFVNGAAVGYATMVIASIAAAPIVSGGSQGLVLDVVRRDSNLYINARWTRAVSIGWVPSAGMTATSVPVACVGFSDGAGGRTEGQPFFSTQGSCAFSYMQFDALNGTAQPSEAYRYTSVSADTSLRSPISGSGPNVALEGAQFGGMPAITPSTVGITAVDYQLDGGPMNDPMGVEVRVRERWTFAH
jgi:hypothetical protein